MPPEGEGAAHGTGNPGGQGLGGPPARPTFTAGKPPRGEAHRERVREDGPNVSEEVKAIFRKNCQECHGRPEDVRRPEYPRLSRPCSRIASWSPASRRNRRIFQRISSKSGDIMPKKPNPPLRAGGRSPWSGQWILTGAWRPASRPRTSSGPTPAPETEPVAARGGRRPLRPGKKVLADVRQQRRSGEDVRSLRYFNPWRTC